MIQQQETPQHKIDACVARDLVDKGYRRISKKHCRLSRIDRPDWKEHMARSLAPWSHSEGIDRVMDMGETGMAEDMYRRCYSKDTIKVSREVSLKVPCSSYERTGYVEF